MASNKKDGASWVFRLVTAIVTLAVMVCVFVFAFVRTGNEPKAMFSAAVPFVSAVVVSWLLTRINKISHKGWHIYVVVLLIGAVISCLKIARVF